MGQQKGEETKQNIPTNGQEGTPPLSPEHEDKPPGRISKLPIKCPLSKCLLCTREQPYCLVRSPTWPAIMRVVFYVLKFDKPEREFFNLKEDVYNVMLWHWSKLSIGKKSSANWKKHIQDMLSHSKELFESGLEIYGQNGYWRLKVNTDPWTLSGKTRRTPKRDMLAKRAREADSSEPYPKRPFVPFVVRSGPNGGMSYVFVNERTHPDTQPELHHEHHQHHHELQAQEQRSMTPTYPSEYSQPQSPAAPGSYAAYMDYQRRQQHEQHKQQYEQQNSAQYQSGPHYSPHYHQYSPSQSQYPPQPYTPTQQYHHSQPQYAQYSNHSSYSPRAPSPSPCPPSQVMHNNKVLPPPRHYSYDGAYSNFSTSSEPKTSSIPHIKPLEVLRQRESPVLPPLDQLCNRFRTFDGEVKSHSSPSTPELTSSPRSPKNGSPRQNVSFLLNA